MRIVTPLEHSIQSRLALVAKELRVDPNLVLTRYAAERLLHRLASSRHADRFVLKGAMMLVVWLGDIVRPTRDVDLLGFGDMTDAAIAETFAEVAAVGVEPDGVVFDPSSVRVERIREEDAYGGRRVTLRGVLGRARLHVQIDVGIGDAVYPAPEVVEYPSMLDLPRPRLKGVSSGDIDCREVSRDGNSGRKEQPHARLLRYPGARRTRIVRRWASRPRDPNDLRAPRNPLCRQDLWRSRPGSQ